MSLHFRECKFKNGRREKIRSRAIKTDSVNAILMALTPPNRLACIVSLTTGLRIGDVLALKTEQVQKDRFTVTEEKTGKKRRITLPRTLREDCLKLSGNIFVFEHRLSKWKHRTRQAVWKDLHRAAKHLRLKGLSPHSMRKTYSRNLLANGLTLTEVQKKLLHSSPEITAIYLLADELERK